MSRAPTIVRARAALALLVVGTPWLMAVTR